MNGNGIHSIDIKIKLIFGIIVETLIIRFFWERLRVEERDVFPHGKFRHDEAGGVLEVAMVVCGGELRR